MIEVLWSTLYWKCGFFLKITSESSEIHSLPLTTTALQHSRSHLKRCIALDLKFKTTKWLFSLKVKLFIHSLSKDWQECCLLAQWHTSEKEKKGGPKRGTGVAEHTHIFVSLAELNILWHSMTDEMLACWDQQKCQAGRNLPQTLGTVTTHGVLYIKFILRWFALPGFWKNIVLHIDSFMALCFMASRLLFVFGPSTFPYFTSKVSPTILMTLKRTQLRRAPCVFIKYLMLVAMVRDQVSACHYQSQTLFNKTLKWAKNSWCFKRLCEYGPFWWQENKKSARVKIQLPAGWPRWQGTRQAVGG